MAASYEYSPLSVPTFFRSIVAIVSENLKYVIDDSIAGKPIQFKHGSWMEIERQLLEDSEHRINKNYKYPCVLLIHPVNEKVDKERNANNVQCDVLIVVDSESTRSVDDRELYSFKRVLYPIYAELLKQIQDSKYYMNYSTLNHTKKDLYHLGQESTSGMMKYKLPDAIDGLALLNLEFDLKQLQEETTDVCRDYDCPNGRTIDVLNYIGEVVIRNVGKMLYVQLVNATYVNADGSTPTYDFYIVDTDTSYPITVGGTANVNLDGLAMGDYRAQIRCGDAYVGLIFSYNGTTVINNTLRVIQTFSMDYACSSYPDYKATIDYTHQLASGNYMVKDLYNNGELQFSQDINESGIIHIVHPLKIDNTSRDMYLYLDSSLNIIENNSIIKLKCN